MKLEQSSVLISGQLITSRTETVEAYLRLRAKYLGVIGIASPFASQGTARISAYENNVLKRQFYYKHVRIDHNSSKVMFVPVFLAYLWSILANAFSLRDHLNEVTPHPHPLPQGAREKKREGKRKFDLFVGVACFSSLAGVLLKKLGVIDKLIYYCIDYYPMPKDLSFNTVIVWAFRQADKLCVRHSDMVWHISPRIAQAREEFAGIRPDEYKHKVVPLGYDSSVFIDKPEQEFDINSIAFVGTLSDNQGLELVVQAMPKVLEKMPDAKVHVIGRGPFEGALKALIKMASLEKQFILYGFIPDEKDVLDIISKCAIGMAPWNSSPEDNSIYADPGKPKLYAARGLPTVITEGPAISNLIEEAQAGFVIKYDKDMLADAILRLLTNKDRLISYRENSLVFARSNADACAIFSKAFGLRYEANKSEQIADFPADSNQKEACHEA
ncbi:glycosyltransferase [Elusimicrobiota bacterium]